VPPGPFMQRPPHIRPTRQQPMFGQMPHYPQLGAMARPRGGGGLLSKIFGRKAAQSQNMVNPFQFQSSHVGRAAASSNGSFLQSLMNPNSLTKVLNNTQQVLHTIQSIGPMVQQYGPLIKNLPALWKLYRGLSNSNSDDSNEGTSNKGTDDEDYEEKTATKKKPKTSSKKKSTQNKKKDVKKDKKVMKRESVPKLYI